MEDKKKSANTDNDSDFDERIRNTAILLADFAKENLDEETAAEIANDLSDVINGNPPRADE